MLSSRFDRYGAGPVLPLHMMSAGESGEIVDVRGGHGVVRRLTEMGPVPGARLRVVSGADSCGALIVRIGDIKLGLGRGLAWRVLIRPTDSSPIR
ncbi:MAG: ferrous iron transport protein A [Armatimonadota bacterium]